jgi:hypothetical protein
MPTQQVTRIKRTSGRVNVTMRDAKGKTKNGIVRATAARPATPVITALTGSTTGGTLAAGTFWYRVSATNANGQGLACVEQSAVVASGTTGSVSITVASVAGATNYNFYGRTQGAELLLVTQAGTTYVDTNAATPSGALPTLATTPGNATVDTNASNYSPQGGTTTVPQALAMRGAGVKYFLRYGNPAGYPQPNRS